MGWLSNLFGGSKEDRALKEVFESIRRLIDDEAYQLSLLNPVIKQMIEKGLACDKLPNASGPFGFSETNPIPVNGALGELAYLSRMMTEAGDRILFHRIGAMGTVDVFEAVTFSGSGWFIFFLDMYHPRRSRATPDGFRFYPELAQFSGFHNYCTNFPYDFIETKHAVKEPLGFAYIPMGNVAPQMDARVYSRPPAHKARLEKIRNRLSSTTTQ